MKKGMYIITTIVILVGIILTAVKGLNYSVDIKGGTRIQIGLETDYNIKEIKQIAKEVFPKEVLVEKIEATSEVVSIITEEATEENLEVLVAKLNEKYETDVYKTENLLTSEVPNIRVRDLAQRYVFPLGVASVIAVIYTAIISKNKMKDTLIMAVGIVLATFLLLSILAIIQIPVNRGMLTAGIIAVIMTITFITIILSKNMNQKDRINNLMLITGIAVISAIAISLIGFIADKELLIFTGVELTLGILISAYSAILAETVEKEKIKE